MFCFGYNAIPMNTAYGFSQMINSMNKVGLNLGIALATSGPGLPVPKNNQYQQNYYKQPISFGPFNKLPGNYTFNNNYYGLNNGFINFNQNNSGFSFGGFNQPMQSGFSLGGGFNQPMPSTNYFGLFNQPFQQKSYFAELKPPTNENSNPKANENEKPDVNASKSKNNNGIRSASVNTDGATINRKDNGYGPEFLNKVKDIASRINCDYRDLLGLMNSESGIDASAKNPHGSASGLIQIVDSSAREIGTSSAEIRNMDPITQLDYVEKYLARAKQIAGFSPDRQLSAGDLYAIVFLPGRAQNDTLTSSGESYYAQNYTGLDLDSDGKITKSDLAQKIQSHHVSDTSFLA